MSAFVQILNVVTGTDVSASLNAPAAAINEALAATDTAVKAWQKAMAAIEAVAIQYGLETKTSATPGA